MIRTKFLAAAVLAAFSSSLNAQPVPANPLAPATMPDQQADEQVTGHIFRPKQLPPPEVSA